MPIDFNPQALDMFRNAQLANENSVANLDGKGGIKTNGTFHSGNIFRTIGRSGDERRANNEVRTALLKSLGNAFGLSGMSEADGKVTFSREFMESLEKILGRDVLKSDDFKLNADGSVTSGRPLTQRRITAILDKATIIGKSDFDVDVYREKLDAIKKELGIAGLSEKDLKKAIEKQPGLEMFVHAEKALDLLKNGLFMARQVPGDFPGETKIIYGPKGIPEDHSIIRNDPAYQFNRECGDDTTGMNKFQFRDPATGEYKELAGTADFSNKVLWHALGGEFIHLERASFREKESDDIEPLKKYISQTVQLFAQKMVDVYFDAKEAGKLPEFLEHLKEPGACMEEKGLQLANFQARIAPKVEGQAPSRAEAAELERIANIAAGENAPPPKSEDLLYGVIDALNQSDAKFNNSEDWNDFSALAREKLIGKTAQIVTPKEGKNGIYSFEPVMKDGKPVIRPLTAEDIDTIGRACLHNISNI
ncbi:MAG: hypothetical protein IK027_04100 [Deltaproteobacteria bacterium]|nr:hypothetical protein [Deltaproteobacteria bacterium]